MQGRRLISKCHRRLRAGIENARDYQPVRAFRPIGGKANALPPQALSDGVKEMRHAPVKGQANHACGHKSRANP